MSQRLATQETQPHATAPAWWQTRQKEAWKQYHSLAMPTRQDEDWRFTSLSPITTVEKAVVAQPLSPKQIDELIERSKPGFSTAAQAIFANDQLVDRRGDLPAGVIWEPMDQAWVKHTALLETYFMRKSIGLGSDKFAALHMANCRSGMLLYVPKNVEVQLPLCAYHWVDGENSAIFPHTLIIAEDNARVVMMDVYRSASEATNFLCTVNDWHVGSGASVTYIASQDLSEKSLSIQLNATEVGRDASAKSLFVNTGSAFARLESKSTMLGKGARSEMLSVSVGDAKQEFDQRTLQQHSTPNAWSDLLYKNVLDFNAKTIFKGLIRVDPGASQTDAYQTNRNLLLAPTAEANSMPGLEILNDDVKCSHGATTGQIDEAQLFYMQARGIQPQRARQLLAHGFCDDVLDKLGNQKIAEMLRQQILAKFARSHAPMESEAEQAIDETDVRQLQGTV